MSAAEVLSDEDVDERFGKMLAMLGIPAEEQQAMIQSM